VSLYLDSAVVKRRPCVVIEQSELSVLGSLDCRSLQCTVQNTKHLDLEIVLLHQAAFERPARLAIISEHLGTVDSLTNAEIIADLRMAALLSPFDVDRHVDGKFQIGTMLPVIHHGN
jgi:hypothetical protein